MSLRDTLPLECPFCGSGPERIYIGQDEYQRPFFYCRDCFAQTCSRLDRKSALALWNNRISYPNEKLLKVAKDYVEIFLRNHHCAHAHNETCNNCKDIVDLINEAEGKIKGSIAEA